MRKKIKSGAGYTLIEMIVAIAIMSIMLAIVVGTYSFGKNYDILQAETSRLATVVRNARGRDFNGIVWYNGTANVYPTGGYGVHIKNDALVCSGNPNLFCASDAECIANNSGSCNARSGRTSYILYADFDGAGHYGGASEKVDHFEIPSNFTVVFPGGASEGDILFKNNSFSISEGAAQSSFSVPLIPYILTVKYKDCSNAVQRKSGTAIIDIDTNKIYEQLVDC